MKIPPIPYQDLLRLEVETTPAGLPNLVQNPSGEKGAWGWITPVANTNMTADTALKRLTFVTTPSQAAYFTTEHLKVTAGQYVGARLDLVAITASHNVKARFEWYDAAKVLLSSSTQTAALSALGTQYVPAVAAPASTVYAKLRLDFYNGVANPSAAAAVTFNQVMVTYAATAGALQTTRTNRMTNPSFETNTTGWTTSFGATLTRVTTQFDVGTASGQLAPSGSSPSAYGPSFAVTGGADYVVQLRVRSASTASARVGLLLFDAGGNPLPSAYGATTSIPANTWTSLTATMTLPGNAATAQLVFNSFAVVTYFLDTAMVEKVTTVGTYFDGSFASGGGLTYAWTGTAHASTSTEVATSYAFSEPISWKNILGPSHEIGIERRALDVGTLSATVFDATLNPATAAEIRPGKRIRLRVNHASFSGGWESAFEGVVATGSASYSRKDDGSLRTRVELSAVDNIATLANQGELRGVATIAELPYLLEGKGVPWLVNGSGNQVTSATVVSNNDSASVLDQVSIVRDTALGQAFVDRNGVLVVRTTPTTVTDGFSDVPADITAGKFGYSDIDTDFSSDNLINEVLVEWLRYNSTTGETTVITYGPYRDTNSIATWGVRSATFTIQGATENPTTIAAYAQSILTANATPVNKVRSLTMPVKTTETLVPATRYDLGHKVPVKFSSVINASYVVTGISHRITPELWQVTYEFDPDGAVASPTMTPSPPRDPVVKNAVTSGVVGSVQAGWTLSAQRFYRDGRYVHAWVSFTKATAALSLGQPNHTDQLLATVDPAWCPVEAVGTASANTFRHAVLYTSGNIYLTAGMSDSVYTNSNVALADQVNLSFTYLLPEGV